MLKVNAETQYRHHCCGHSDVETVAMARLRCSRCGALLRRTELQLGLDGFTHTGDGGRCGPVIEERARSHADLVDWLWQAVDPQPRK